MYMYFYFLFIYLDILHTTVVRRVTRNTELYDVCIFIYSLLHTENCGVPAGYPCTLFFCFLFLILTKTKRPPGYQFKKKCGRCKRVALLLVFMLFLNIHNQALVWTCWTYCFSSSFFTIFFCQQCSSRHD